jgi:hypothetical protein
MYGVLCDILAKDDASHMNARATIPNSRTVKRNGGGTVCNFFPPLYKYREREGEKENLEREISFKL